MILPVPNRIDLNFITFCSFLVAFDSYLVQYINKVIKMTDAFCGKYIVDKREGYDEFMKGIGKCVYVS